jgi:hypothetical protein
LYQLFTKPTQRIVNHFRSTIIKELELNAEHFTNKLLPLDLITILKRPDLDLIISLYFIIVWISINKSDMDVMLVGENDYIRQQFPLYITEVCSRCIRGVRLDTGEPFRKANPKKNIQPPTHAELMSQNTYAVVKDVREWYLRHT